LIIEKARFEDRLSLDVDIAPGFYNIKLPVFTLQPLIENAIKHGISNMIEPGIIKLSAERSNGFVVITIEDNAGTCGALGSSGLGLRIVEKRIMNLYGENSCLEVQCVPDELTSIRIKLPVGEGAQ
jgi:two-component system LytT family sensor kinase